MNIITLKPPIVKNNVTYNYCQILKVDVNLGYNADIWAMLLPSIENWTICEEIHYSLTEDQYKLWKDDDNYIVYIVKQVIGFFK